MTVDRTLAKRGELRELAGFAVAAIKISTAPSWFSEIHGKSFGEPDAGNPHVRFDERWRAAAIREPVLERRERAERAGYLTGEHPYWESSAVHSGTDSEGIGRPPAVTKRGACRGSNLPSRHRPQYRASLAIAIEGHHCGSAKEPRYCRQRPLSGLQSARPNRPALIRVPR